MFERRSDFPARDPAAVGRHDGCESGTQRTNPMKIGSADQDTALEECVQRLFVVMKPAGPDGVEVPGLLGLAG